MTRLRIALPILLFMGWYMADVHAQESSVLVDKIIANVGSEAIFYSDIEEQYYAMVAQNGKAVPEDIRCLLFDQLLTQKLLLFIAERDSTVTITDDDVESQLDSRMKQILQYMGGDEDRFKEYYGASIPEVKERFRDDMHDQILTQRMQEHITSSVKVTPAEVMAFFEMVPTDSLPYFNSEVEVAQLVMKPKVNAAESLKAYEALSDIRQRIQSGKETFEALAKKYSADFESAKQGGDLGWANRGSYVPEFEAAAYNLAKGELSPVIKTEYGYHLIQLIERKGNTIHCRHILIKPSITQQDVENTRHQLDSIRNVIANDTLSFEAAVSKYSDDEATKNNAGTILNPATGTSYFEIGDLPTDIYFAIDNNNLAVGKISEPLEFQTEQGETAFRLILLKSQTEPHRANLQQDYARVQQVVLQQKKNYYANSWLIEHMPDVYVNINPEYPYTDCPSFEKWKTIKTQ